MLQLLFGNNWQGRKGEALVDYVEGAAAFHDYMGFCEVNHLPDNPESLKQLYVQNKSDLEGGHPAGVMVNQFAVLSERLSWIHDGYFDPENREPYTCAVSGVCYEQTEYGNATFIGRGDLTVLERGVIFILGAFNEKLENGSSSRNMPYVVLEKGGEVYVIAQWHGVWYQDADGNTKGDGPLRTQQSARVVCELERLAAKYGTSKVIFGGDFNLDINTHALAMLKQGSAAGSMTFRNLVEERGVTTRTPLYRSFYANVSHYADYVFVSEGVEVETFELMGSEISDHYHISVGVR